MVNESGLESGVAGWKIAAAVARCLVVLTVCGGQKSALAAPSVFPDHTTPTVESCGIPTQGAAPVTDAFPPDVVLPRLEIGIEAIQLSPHHTGPAEPRPFACLVTIAAFWDATVTA